MDETTYSSGQATRSNSNEVSFFSGGSAAPGGAKSTIPLPSQIAQAITIGGQTISFSPADADALIISDQTLSIGGPAATIPPPSAPAPPNALSVLAAAQTAASAIAILTFGSKTYTAHASWGLAIGTTTLRPGSPALTAGDTIISLPSGGDGDGDGEAGILVANPSTTSTIRFFAAGGSESVVAIADHTYTTTVLNQAAIDLASTTLALGDPAATLAGHAVSLGAAGVVFVDGSPTPGSILRGGGLSASMSSRMGVQNGAGGVVDEQSVSEVAASHVAGAGEWSSSGVDASAVETGRGVGEAAETSVGKGAGSRVGCGGMVVGALAVMVWVGWWVHSSPGGGWEIS